MGNVKYVAARKANAENAKRRRLSATPGRQPHRLHPEIDGTAWGVRRKGAHRFARATPDAPGGAPAYAGPADGHLYTKQEIATVFAGAPDGRQKLIWKDMWARGTTLKSYPTCSRYFNEQKIALAQGGQYRPRAIGLTGRPPVADITTVEQWATDMPTDGSSTNHADVAALLSQQLRTNNLAAGLDPVLGSRPLSKKTTSRYMAMLANQAGVGFTTRPVQKTRGRYIQTHGCRATFTNAVMLASLCYRVDPDGPVGQTYTEPMAQHMSDAHGGAAVVPITPGLITSQDDTHFHFVDDAGGAGVPGWVVYKENPDVSLGTRAVHGPVGARGEDAPCGIRAAATFTIAGDGQIAPLFLRFNVHPSDLLPPDGVDEADFKGYLVIKVPSLRKDRGTFQSAAGGGTVVVARRGHAGVDQAITRYYEDEVKAPWLQAQRERYGCPSTGEVPDAYQSANLRDGAGGGLAAMVDAALQVEHGDRKESDGKHPNSTTEIHQACDVWAFFKELKRLAAVTSLEDHASLQLRDAIMACFERHSSVFRSTKAKKKLMAELSAALPLLMEKSPACHQSSVVKAFVGCGCLASAKNPAASYHGAMATRRKKYTAEEAQLCKTGFSRALRAFLDEGYCAEALLDELGIPQDRDEHGVIVVKAQAAISNPGSWRATNLSAPALRDRRTQAQAAADAKERGRVEAEGEARAQWLALNATAEAALKTALKKPATSGRRVLNGLTFAHVGALTVPLLKAFIVCRTSTCSTPARGTTAGNKLNAAAAAGTDCLILRAHALKGTTTLTLTLPPAWTPAPAPAPSASAAHAGFVASSDPTSLAYWGCADDRTAASFVRDLAWAQRLRAAVAAGGPGGTYDDAEATADLLCTLILGRLRNHLDRRVKDKRQHLAHVWAAFAANVPRLAAAAVLWGYAVQDISAAGADGCLIALPGSTFLLSTHGVLGGLSGCYGYFDTVRGVWCRWGAVLPTNTIDARGAQHIKGAENAHLPEASRFYRQMPLKGSPRASSRTRDGYFDNLAQFVGWAYDPRDAGQVALHVDTSPATGVWAWPSRTVQRYSTTGDLEAKLLESTSYMLELFFDLAISPSNNLSDSAGYECHGQAPKRT